LDIYAIMSFKGTFDGEYIKIQEEEILREQRIDDIFWCIKDYSNSKDSGAAILIQVHVFPARFI